MLTNEAVHERPIRLMFQDEARYGRMARIRRCWAPAPLRPMVRNGYERQFTYVYGAVSPLQGQLDWRLSPNMNTEQMNGFLLQVSSSRQEPSAIAGRSLFSPLPPAFAVVPQYLFHIPVDLLSLSEPDKRLSHTSGSSVGPSVSLRSTTRVQVFADSGFRPLHPD